jgi:Uncharacterized protein conserved in bacteria (DUF2332)
MMHGHDPARTAAENYREFAQDAYGRSPAYESLAGSVADDTAVLRFLGSLPPEKRQPNLLFAAARYLLGDPVGITRLRALVRRNRAELSEVMLARRTQTIEPARCATLLPALAQLTPPLALIEVGASAGLTLLFDRYSYDYAGHQIAGQDPQAPTLRCTPRGPADRLRCADTVRGLPAVWLSNEGPGVLPGLTLPAYKGWPFVLARDGQTPIAFTDSHGTWLHWLATTMS